MVNLMFGGYRDVELVGEGGLGRVYRAVRVSTGGVVAIKELREVPSASPAWHRAKRELEAMLRLKGHPFVVSVEEIIDGPEGPCLVMEYLDGGSLMELLTNGPLSVPELLLVGQQVCQALADAHEVGIVHRDIKPHNLLVGAFGQVKVADFGIAALTRGAGLNTRTQAFTLAYASPEELDGDAEVGPPADVYSFAATMSHLATGRKPSFRDGGVSADLSGVKSLHRALAPVVTRLRRCLVTNPTERPTIRELQQVFGAAMSKIGADGITALKRDRVIAPRDSVEVTPAEDVEATVVKLSYPPAAPPMSPSPLTAGPTIESTPALTVIKRASSRSTDDATTSYTKGRGALERRSRSGVLVFSGVAAVAALIGVIVVLNASDGTSPAGSPTIPSEGTRSVDDSSVLNFKESAEDFIVGDEVESQAGTTFHSATCVAPATSDVGEPFTCVAIDADGARWTFDLVVTSAEGFQIIRGGVSDLIVGVALDTGGSGDGTFNDLARRGAVRAASQLGAAVQELEATFHADRVPNLEALSAAGNNPVIAVGFAFGDAIALVSAANPDTIYGWVDGYLDLPNVKTLAFAEEQGSFLVGAAAALACGCDHIGFIGGQEIDLIKKFEVGYTAGAKQINPDIVVEVQYLGAAGDNAAWGSSDKAKEIALGWFADGVEVIYTAAGGSGQGTIDAAVEADKWAIGVDSDQYLTATPEQQAHILTSMLKRVDNAVFQTIKAVQDGDLSGGFKVFDLSVDGVGYSTSGGYLDEFAAQLDDLKAQIVSGDIVVPTGF